MGKVYLKRGLFAAFGLLVLLLPWLLTQPYHLHLLNVTVTYIIIGLGLYYSVGLTGIISIAQPAFWGIGAYTSALLAVRLDVPFWIGIVAAVVITALIGLMVGVPTLRVSGLYLAMVTIGFLELVRLVLWNWTDVTYGSVGVGNIPRPEIFSFKFSDPRHFYYLSLAILIVLIIITVLIKDSRIGRAFRSIREDELAASVMGINVPLYKSMAFSISASFAGIAGSLFAHFSMYINPDMVSFPEAIKQLSMVVLGGSGSIVGAILGSSVVYLLPEVLKFLQEYYMAIYGIGLIFIIVFVPGGLVALFQEKLFPLFNNLIKGFRMNQTRGRE